MDRNPWIVQMGWKKPYGQGTRQPSVATLEMLDLKSPGRWRRRLTAIIAAAVLVAVLLSALGQVSGQQHPYAPPPPSITKNHGSVLELPRTLSSHSNDSSRTTSPRTSQFLPELQTPPRALREHPGYEQVTLTVTDQNGRYVTGLQEGDFRVYIDGIGRSVKFLRQDRNTPVSVGILADTSGSMRCDQTRTVARGDRTVHPQPQQSRRRISSRILEPCFPAPAVHT